jgi:hypothetical protein
MEPNQIWHRRLAHVHYRALPIASKAMGGLPEIKTKNDGICKGCAKGKNISKHFQVISRCYVVIQGLRGS